MTAGYVAQLEAAIVQARRELWWFIERDNGEGWGFDESDVDEIASKAMRIQDEILLAALAPAGDTIELTAEEAEQQLDAWTQLRDHDAIRPARIEGQGIVDFSPAVEQGIELFTSLLSRGQGK